MGIQASQTAMNVGIGAHTAFGLKTDCVDPLAKGGGTEASFFCMLEVASKTIGVPIRFGMEIIKNIVLQGLNQIDICSNKNPLKNHKYPIYKLIMNS